MEAVDFFDWSFLNRQQIKNHIMKILPLVENKTISVRQLHKYFSYNLKKLAPLKIKRKYTDDVGKGHLFIGGSYYSYLDFEKERSIEICFYFNNLNDQIFLNKHSLEKTAVYIADTLLHEIIHMRQYRRRGFRSLPDYQSTAEKTEIRKEQAYLGCSDEIDAYAFNIACELRSKFHGDNSKIIKYLNKKLTNHHFKNSWRIYLKAFEYDHNHPIIKRLKKKIIRYIPAAEFGRPYKNNYWINW